MLSIIDRYDLLSLHCKVSRDIQIYEMYIPSEIYAIVNENVYIRHYKRILFKFV